MFNTNQVKKLQRLLGIKNKDNATLFAYRLQKFLEKNELKQNAIIKGINIILEDIHKKEIDEAEQKIKINLKNITNPILRKYGIEILKLSEEGLGARRIKKLLELEHNAKISHQTIYKFIKSQKEGKKDA
jgi:hypothetical protein